MSFRLATAAAGVSLLFIVGCGEAPPRAPQQSQTANIATGVPGGVITTRTEVTARVTFKNDAKRQVTLLNSDGQQKVFDVPKEVVNFDQVQAGDLVVITITEQLAIAVFDAATTVEQGEAAVVARAEKGEKPAGAVMSVTQVRGVVSAIDLAKRTATVSTKGGQDRVVHVREDIDLAKHRVGDQVVMRITQALEMRLEKKSEQPAK